MPLYLFQQNRTEDDMAKHSSIIGGSTADRLLNCPGSYQQTLAIPDLVDIPSEYANYGSAMHAVMDRLVTSYADGFPLHEEPMFESARELLGETFYDRVLEEHHLTDSIYLAINTLYDLMDEYGRGFVPVANELKVKFPGIPGAFGTSDLLIANKKHVVMVDWKFGQGVPVFATYKDEHGERVNPQLMFYFAGALDTLAAKIFHGKRFVVAIIQPRTEVPLTHTVITRAEVKMFEEDVNHAVMKALERNPPLAIGEHCRWCPARPHCPAHTEPLFELNELGPAPAMPLPVDGDNGDYGRFLAKAKYLADMAADYKKSVDEAVHTYLSAGGTVPGWRLKLKTKLRQWIDENIVQAELTKLGFGTTDIFQTKLQTFGHTDKVAKKLGVKIPDHLRVAPETDETVLARTDDPAPVVDRAAAAAELQDALKQLRHDTKS
jgi:hypothetical protein